MGVSPYGDATIIYHVLFALLVPLGWAVILYPYWRLHREQWYKTLIFVAVLSFSFMVGKEIYLDREISSDDIAADLLGLFFGTAIALLLLYLERAIARSRKKTDDRATPPRKDDTDRLNHRAPTAFPREVSLRDILGILTRIHERGSLLYEKAAGDCDDQGSKVLASELAKTKKAHARAVESLLTRWPAKPPDVSLLDRMDERISRDELFSRPIARDTTERQLLDYAVEQENKIHTLFAGFHDHFQGYSWRTIQYENVILDLKGHVRKLEELYRKREKDEAADPPARAVSPGKRAAEPAKRHAAGGGATILVVDDEEGIRAAVAEYLADSGLGRVDTARDGQEALDQFEGAKHDIVVVDIAMPKMHGIDVLKQIKALSPHTEVIIITGRAGKNSAIAALKLGAFDYIEKPFDFAALAKSVAEGLKKKRLIESGG